MHFYFKVNMDRRPLHKGEMLYLQSQSINARYRMTVTNAVNDIVDAVFHTIMTTDQHKLIRVCDVDVSMRGEVLERVMDWFKDCTVRFVDRNHSPGFEYSISVDWS